MGRPRTSTDDKGKFPEYTLNIQPLAKAKGIKHGYDLWKRVGGSMQTASNIWKGKFTAISLEMLSRLCFVLDCEPGQLFAKVNQAKVSRDDHFMEQFF